MDWRNLNLLTAAQTKNLNQLLCSRIRAFCHREEYFPLNQMINQAVPMPTFMSDPFEGNINPGDANSQELFTLATAEQSKESKITVSQDQDVNVMNLFCQDSNSFGQGILTGCIETEAGKCVVFWRVCIY